MWEVAKLSGWPYSLITGGGFISSDGAISAADLFAVPQQFPIFFFCFCRRNKANEFTKMGFCCKIYACFGRGEKKKKKEKEKRGNA